MSRNWASLVGVFFFAAVLTIGGYLFYIGLFAAVPVETKEMRSLFLVFKPQVGEYRQSAKTIGDLMKELHALGIQDLKGFGIYYDDPETVSEEKLRSEAGVILPEGDKARAAAVVARYSSRVFPVTEGAVATFPLRNSLSFPLGAYKVYPILTEFLERRDIPRTYSLEIYDFGHTITYFMPFPK